MSTSTLAPESATPQHDRRYGAGRDLTIPRPRPTRPTGMPARDPYVTYGIPPAIRRNARPGSPMFEPPARIKPQAGATVHFPQHHEAGVSMPTMKRTTKQYERHAAKHTTELVKVSAALQGVPVSIADEPTAKKPRAKKPTVREQVLDLHARGASTTSIAETLDLKTAKVEEIVEAVEPTEIAA